jgi:outer membrane lipoprotein-sorting protein
VDGLVIPHLIETQIKDRPEVINITVENVELDPELDDSRFHFPE